MAGQSKVITKNFKMEIKNQSFCTNANLQYLQTTICPFQFLQQTCFNHSVAQLNCNSFFLFYSLIHLYQWILLSIIIIDFLQLSWSFITFHFFTLVFTSFFQICKCAFNTTSNNSQTKYKHLKLSFVNDDKCTIHLLMFL